MVMIFCYPRLLSCSYSLRCLQLLSNYFWLEISQESHISVQISNDMYIYISVSVLSQPGPSEGSVKSIWVVQRFLDYLWSFLVMVNSNNNRNEEIKVRIRTEQPHQCVNQTKTNKTCVYSNGWCREKYQEQRGYGRVKKNTGPYGTTKQTKN